jgi:alpha-amylase
LSGTVRLVFGVHSHQPMGNFDDVFARALDHAYDPFLDALARHPSIKAVLHYSGCLCEWMEAHAPAHLDRVARLARSGQVEILGGGFYEPILSLIPPTDRLGQLRLQTRYVRDRFGADVRGMWLPERIWEPTLPGILREAGIDYALLDDYHFLSSMDGDPVGGYYVTEDQGDPIHLFPISERLRYLIPFRDAGETIAHLKALATAPASPRHVPVAVIVDDGEKFGLWPGTREWVYGRKGEGGWLESFLRALEENASWLKTSTFAEVRRDIEPRGRVYLPPGSYFEMGAWALPAGRGREFDDEIHAARNDGAWARRRPFLRGGFFRNFQAKYSESLLLVRRAQMLSAMLDEDTAQTGADRSGFPSPARRELWRAMCNCSYWHGIFGGLYLPHIRRAVGEHLCRAQRLADPRRERLVSRFVDADADGRLEVEIQTPRLGLLVEPERGGALSVIDFKEKDFPLGLTLTRRMESYHREVLEAKADGASDSDHASIHEVRGRATEEMKALVVADDRPRASAVDRFLDAGARPEDLHKAVCVDRGDFFDGRYAPTLLPQTSTAEFAGVVLSREGKVAGRPLSLIKTIRAGRSGRDLEVLHKLGGAPAGAAVSLPGVQFAVEFNLALIEEAGRIVVLDGPDAGRALSLSREAEAGVATAVRVEEGHAGFTLTFKLNPAAAVWHYPIRTVSRSEEGYEAIYQGSALLFVWGGGGAVPGETRIEMAIGGPPTRDPAPVR